MPFMTVILLSSEENEFSLLCFHILIYCLTTGKSGVENSALLVETCEQSPCRKQPSKYQDMKSPTKFVAIGMTLSFYLTQVLLLLVRLCSMKLRLVATQEELKFQTCGFQIWDTV